MDNAQRRPAAHPLALTPSSHIATPPSGYHGQSPTLGSPSDAYYMQGSDAEQGSVDVGIGPAYHCLFPQCEASFPDAAILDQHMALHFGSGSACEDTFARDQDWGLVDHPSTTGTSLEFDVEPQSSSQGTSDRDRCASSMTNESGASADNGTSGHSTAKTQKRWVCLEPQCDRSFNRSTDVIRHMATHATGNKALECPEFGCPRVGSQGFMRRDKVVDHVRSKHKRTVGRDEFRPSYC